MADDAIEIVTVDAEVAAVEVAQTDRHTAKDGRAVPGSAQSGPLPTATTSRCLCEKGDSVIIRELRQVSEEQIDQLADILIAVVAQGASVGFLPPLGRDEAAAYWRAVVKPEVILLVAERDGRIVGTAQLELAMRANGRHRAEVNKVLVHPDCQRQGIGRRLMAEIEVVARREGRSLLFHDPRVGDPSNDLYRALGWIEAGRIPKWARSASGSLDATVFYFKELA
jgi:GNAT superfamily N-acetyltransferase